MTTVPRCETIGVGQNEHDGAVGSGQTSTKVVVSRASARL
jgi:hypothetical protein